MFGGKKRLYVALYPSGVSDTDTPEERKYHWALLVGRKDETAAEVPGTCYHVKNAPRIGWEYEKVNLKNVKNTAALLVRVLIAKITNEERLEKIIEETPVVQNNPDRRCRAWVADVVKRIAADGRAVGSAQLNWDIIEAKCREYVEEHMVKGRFATLDLLDKPKPTWDMVAGQETVP